jgi:hypothetical protein
MDIMPDWKAARLRNWWSGGGQRTPSIAGWVLEPGAKLPSPGSLESFWTDVDFIIERKMAEIEQTTCYGCAVPYHYIDQGSSAMAGVLGCPLKFVDEETVWADPCGETIEAALRVRLDASVPVYSRIHELTRRSVALAKDHHFVAAFALEGMSDLLAAIYGIEPFLMDTLDRPDEVLRAAEHLHGIWMEAWGDIQALLRESGNPGGIGWAGVWAPGSTFPLQEDVAYNLSPTQFRDFCLPSLRERIAAMECPFFHLDGVGMLPHLSMLLELENLPVIQWQPGAGQERLDAWYEVIRRILGAGKRIQLYARAEEVEPLVNAVGADGLFLVISDATHETMAKLLNDFPQ